MRHGLSYALTYADGIARQPEPGQHARDMGIHDQYGPPQRAEIEDRCRRLPPNAGKLFQFSECIGDRKRSEMIEPEVRMPSLDLAQGLDQPPRLHVGESDRRDFVLDVFHLGMGDSRRRSKPCLQPMKCGKRHRVSRAVADRGLDHLSDRRSALYMRQMPQRSSQNSMPLIDQIATRHPSNIEQYRNIASLRNQAARVIRRHRPPSARISRAALWPGAPVTPPPGWVPAPHM